MKKSFNKHRSKLRAKFTTKMHGSKEPKIDNRASTKNKVTFNFLKSTRIRRF